MAHISAKLLSCTSFSYFYFSRPAVPGSKLSHKMTFNNYFLFVIYSRLCFVLCLIFCWLQFPDISFYLHLAYKFIKMASGSLPKVIIFGFNSFNQSADKRTLACKFCNSKISKTHRNCIRFCSSSCKSPTTELSVVVTVHMNNLPRKFTKLWPYTP
jgi:hypothetical protein